MSMCPYCRKFGACDLNFGARLFHRCDDCFSIYNAISPDASSLLSSCSEIYSHLHAIDQLENAWNKICDHISSMGHSHIPLKHWEDDFEGVTLSFGKKGVKSVVPTQER
jgi:hypothetical protein